MHPPRQRSTDLVLRPLLAAKAAFPGWAANENMVHRADVGERGVKGKQRQDSSETWIEWGDWDFAQIN